MSPYNIHSLLTKVFFIDKQWYWKNYHTCIGLYKIVVIYSTSGNDDIFKVTFINKWAGPRILLDHKPFKCASEMVGNIFFHIGLIFKLKACYHLLLLFPTNQLSSKFGDREINK